ncbi:MAG: MaoC family dehydratase N-terminal domain-containing protein [Dehalococcoidia bacterium]|nr:MaoC family dehydratase N-terminal domain-containing protein [Dehalococcoidia bacterium]
MVLESGEITREGVEKLRARLGSFNRPRQYGVGLFNEQASQDAIRHFCQGIGDSNPLYWDLSYGHATKFGTILAPPCFLYSVYWTSGRVGGLPGVHGFHAGNDWEWFQPIRLDDKISVQEQFTGLEEKESQFAGKILIQSSVSYYYNQRGEAIAKTRGWQIRAERSAARERRKYNFEPYNYSRDEIAAIQEAVLGEEIRGNNPRWFEDVNVGDELKPVVKGPMSHGDITAFVAGCIGGISHGIQLNEMLRHPSWGFTDPSTGALEAVIRVHDIKEAADSAGLPGAYDYGCQRCCWMGHLLTNWVGDHGFVKKMYVELRRFNVLGDTTWCKGKVTGKREENGEHLVDMDVWGENQRKEVTMKGTATVRLPSKLASW